jgi:D-beta-D-heptose 7-phosphate kinase/D-beta-D-heptose 1-phosphate adenosyltransferase
MFDFEKRLTDIGRQTILCIGDLMLDDFVYGEVSRISPEAPAPVIRVSREDVIVGGAGNAAHASLGAKCLFVGVIGDDVAGTILREELNRSGRAIKSHLLVDRSRPTTRKLRFVSEHHSTHLLRADWELAHPLDAKTEAALIKRALALLPKASAVVLSDYAKGVLTPKVIRTVIDRAKKLGKPVVVDPKGSDFSIYRGATVITPNRKELAEATHRRVDTGNDIAAAAKMLAGTVGCKAVLVTLSEEGMLLYTRATGAVHVPAFSVRSRVSGAGDTVAAVLAVMLSPMPITISDAWPTQRRRRIGKAAPPPSRRSNCGRASCPGVDPPRQDRVRLA